MESAEDGKRQFMYANGQLSEEYDLFWDKEFKGYHGLQSMDDIKMISMNSMCSQKLTQTELDHYYMLMRRVCPMMRDEICFQLLSMVMMFDTTNLIEDDSLSLVGDDNSNTSTDSLGPSRSVSPPRNRSSGEPPTMANTNSANKDGSSSMEHDGILLGPKTNTQNGFGEIKVLQKHYIHLLRRRCMFLKGPLLRRLGDPDGLEKIMNSFKLLAQYVPALM